MKSDAGELVYIVDDEPELGEAVSLLLETAAIKSRYFRSPRAFLRIIKPSMPGCILLDVRMPSLSGLEVQQHLIKKRCEQPVIFLSGHGDIPIAVRATRSGAMDFLEKPADGGVLIRKIRAALREDRQRRRARAARDERHKAVEALTERERQVGELLVKGLSSAEMARHMKLSVRTVEMHRLRLMRRLGTRNTAQAVTLLVNDLG